MANRYDRDPDEYGVGRRDNRDHTRDDDDHRQGQNAQGNRFNETRQGSPPNPWRDVRNERDRNDQGYRGRFDQGSGSGRDYRDNVGESNYYPGREQNPGHGSSSYYTSGSDRDNRGSFGGGERDRNAQNWQLERNWQPERNWQDRSWQDRNWQHDPQHRGQRDASANYRGPYQDQAWSRDAGANAYNHESSQRLDSQDRGRSNVNDQNRRFDIDRGWYTPGTSGYGNAGNVGNVQSHYGKGPKGYTRSDERIREDICDRLSDDDEVDARDITVTVKNAEVTLEGTVNDRRSKHRAEDVAESVSGVKDVSNHLRARKGILQELGDKISGDDDAEHHGHRGSGTRNSTVGGAPPVPQKTAH